MIVTHKTFRNLIIVLALLFVALLPFWPYTRWGYFPAGLVAALVIFSFMIKALASPD